ncbi:MAG: protein phosphatase 2C domain-containing protein [Clostridia bacterium]|nr:protein phosphatase 2C domain-containing protein [Clostridia bacterium]
MRIKRNFEVGGASDVGKVRNINQDRILVKIGEEPEFGEFGLFAVADGMGGLSSGEEASNISMRELERWWNERLGSIIHAPHSPDEKLTLIQESLDEQFNLINETIISFGNQVEKKIGTTLTVIFIYHDYFITKHIGDSRIYFIQNDEIKVVTVDHSWVGEQVRQGKMTQAEAKVHPQRNVLTQCVGVRRGLEINGTFGFLNQGTVFLVCSDGLHTMFDESELKKYVKEYMKSGKSAQELAEKLIEIANFRGGPDNVSVIAAWS